MYFSLFLFRSTRRRIPQNNQEAKSFFVDYSIIDAKLSFVTSTLCSERCVTIVRHCIFRLLWMSILINKVDGSPEY